MNDFDMGDIQDAIDNGTDNADLAAAVAKYLAAVSG
jgi:hypothetical protein